MAFRLRGVDYLVNSYIEIEGCDYIYLCDICYQILGTSFANRTIKQIEDHYLVFFNSDVSMYELILDYLKEKGVCYSGVHNNEEEVMEHDRFTC